MSALPPTWTTHRIEQLKRLFDEGLTCSQIAREIDVTRNAVIGKLSRLGLNRPANDAGYRRLSPPRAVTTRQSQVRTLRMMHAEMEAAAVGVTVADETISDARRCSLLELSAESCRWPLGRPGADDFAFCGNAPVDGLPYCPGHARMAYRRSASGRR
jgi:GcrA cell cycle regulator